MGVFVNCTDPTSTCGGGPYSFFGVAGTCDVSTGLCICPPGFTGVDLLSVWNDCHISEPARVAIEAISLAINIAALLFVVYGFVTLLLSWDARLILRNGFIPWFQFPPPSPSHLSYQRQVNERRKRRLFMAIFLNLFSFSAIGVLFQSILLADPVFSVFERPNGFGIFLIAIDIGAIMVALYLVLFAWFDALPSFRLFSKMFPQIRSSFLVQYPNFIFLSAVINCSLTCSLSFGVFFVYSLVSPSSIRIFVIPWGMTVFALEVIIYVCILLAVCVLLIRLINMFSDESSGRASPTRGSVLSQEARNRFREARHTIYAMFYTALFCGPLAVLLCLFMGWHPYALANFFFFVALFQASGAGIVIFTVFVFIFRMHYATKKAIERASFLSNQIEPRVSGDGSISLGGDVHSPNPKFSFVSLESPA